MTPEERDWLRPFVEVRPDSRLMGYPAEAVLTVVFERRQRVQDNGGETAARLYLAVCKVAKEQARATERLRTLSARSAVDAVNGAGDYIAMNAMLGVGIEGLRSLGIAVDWVNAVHKDADVLCLSLADQEAPAFARRERA